MATGLLSVPPASGRLPLLGHIWQLWRHRQQLLPYLTSLAQEGPLVRLEVGSMPIVFVNRPELAHEVMVTKASAFEKGNLFTRMRPLVGDGLATADSETHRRHRRLMQPAFHRSRIAGYGEVMSRRAIAMAESWRPGEVIAVDESMAEFSIGTLAETLFSSSEIARPAVEAIHRDVPVILKNMLFRAMFPTSLERLPITPNREFDAATASLRQVIDDMIALARKAGDTDNLDLLSMLLAARDADTGEALTDAEVRDEVVTILFAGTETAASTLSWACHEIARHPEVEERLLAEIDEVVGSGPVTIEDVPRLDYTRRVLEEALRLHGVTLLMRRTVTEVEIGGHRIPPGTEIAFSLYALHRHPEVYPDPERFDPDRWLPERRREMPREAYLSFGAGARKCIGDVFAQTEMAIALATVLSRWHLRPQPGHTVREATAAMPHPVHLPMLVTARERRSGVEPIAAQSVD